MRRDTGPTVWSVVTFIFTLILALAFFVLLIVMLGHLNRIQKKEESILSLISDTLNDRDNGVVSSCSINKTEIIQWFQCTKDSLDIHVNTNNFTDLLNDIAWKSDLLTKITARDILYTKICLTNATVVHFLINNFINTTFPVNPSSATDGFIYGLPHICEPGSSSGYGYQGFPVEFSDLINFIIANGTSTLGSVPIRFYPDYSIPASIGRTFYDPEFTLHLHSCFTCELYCFMNQPVYMFAFRR
jgi:hypothetical protein